jgi:hypothetical protein
MKTLIMKLLGLNTLAEEIAELKKFQRDLTTAQEGLSAKVDEVTAKVDDMEEFDPSQYVSEDEVNDRIESYIYDNDIASQSYVDDEVESKVSDKVEEAIEELDIEDKVKEVVDNMDKASFGDTEELKSIVREQVKSFMLNSVKVDFIVR